MRLGSYTARFDVRPNRSGPNTFTVQLLHHPANGGTPSALYLALTMLDMDMGVTHVTLRRAGPDVYAGKGSFSMGGVWQIAVSGLGRATARVNVGASTAPSVVVSDSGFHAPVIRTGLPYAGFVTEMRANDVARLNGGIARAGATPHGVDFVAHQPYIYVTDMGDNAVQIVNIHTGRIAYTVPVGLGPAHVVFTPDGRRAYVTDFLSADVSVLDVMHHRLLRRIPVGLNPHGLDITPDGRYVYVACIHSAGVWVIDTRTDRVAATIPTGLEPYGVTMGPAGSDKVYVSDFALNQVGVVSLRSRHVVKRIPVGKAPALMAAAPNGRLYVADHDSDAVTVIAMRSDRVVVTVPVGAGPHGLDVTPDGRYVYVANNNANTVSIIDTRANRVVETVRVPGRPNEVALQQRDDIRP